MKRFFTILVLLSLFGWSNLNAQSDKNVVIDTCLIIQPDSKIGNNGFVFQAAPTTNYVGYEDFISFDWTFGGTEALGYSYIQFDINDVPTNAQIYNAKLSLYYNPTSGNEGQAGNNACLLEVVTSPWNENTITWNTKPSITLNGAVYLPTSTLSNQDYPNIGVTDIVSSWYNNPSSNYGLMLEIIDKSLFNSMKFCSSNYPDTSKRPKLEICYLLATGIENNIKNEVNIKISPNPCLSNLTIETNSNTQQKVEILNLMGQSVYTSSINKKAIVNTSAFANGVYILKLSTAKELLVRKFVRE